MIISLFWLILSVDQLACNVCHSSEVEPASGTSTSALFPSVLSFLLAFLVFFSLILMDYRNGSLGELSKYLCIAKTEHHRLLLICSPFGLYV